MPNVIPPHIVIHYTVYHLYLYVYIYIYIYNTPVDTLPLCRAKPTSPACLFHPLTSSHVYPMARLTSEHALYYFITHPF